MFATNRDLAQWHKVLYRPHTCKLPPSSKSSMSGMSLQNSEKRIGPSTDPWGTPNLTGFDFDTQPLITVT